MVNRFLADGRNLGDRSHAINQLDVRGRGDAGQKILSVELN